MNAAADFLTTIFGVQNGANWLQLCARAVLVLIYGLIVVRVAGRRLFGKWSALDIVVSVIIGSNLSRALTANAPLLGTLAATTLLVGLHFLLSKLAAGHAGAARMLEGSGIRLAEDGRLDETQLQREAVSAADLAEALRQSNLQDVKDARLVVLEPSGKITVIRK